MKTFSGKSRLKNVMKITVFVLITAVVAAAVQTVSADEAEPEYGGTLRITGELDAAGFDAIKARRAIGPGRVIGNLVMEKLFERGELGELIPVLGLSAESFEDGKKWTVTLRKGVKFHDGTPFNADAVVKHWQRMLDPENRYRQRLLFQPLVSVVKKSDFEVEFNLKHAWLPFTAVLTDPSGFTSLIPSPQAVENDTQNRKPVGTGPFIFKEWQAGDRIVVAKNPEYRRQGIPYLDKIIYRPISDHESRYAALISGQADIMITDRPTHVKKLTASSDFSKFVLDFRGAGVLVLNNRKPPLDDVRVRRALALAWDQKKYISASYKDITPPAEHWLGDAVNCNDTGYLHPDLQKAKSLIQEYGKPVELEYVHSATSRGREAGFIVQQLFKKAGVMINPTPSDFPGIMKRVFTRQFDIVSWPIRGGYDMGPFTMGLLHSQSPWNVSGYKSEAVDKLLVKQRLSTDPDVREETLCKIVRKVNSDAPFLYLFSRRYYLFAKKVVKNMTLPKLGEEGSPMGINVWIDK